MDEHSPQLSSKSAPQLRFGKIDDLTSRVAAATDAGLKSVRGRYVVVMDADLQNDPHDIPAMLSHLDTWDAVTGWRVGWLVVPEHLVRTVERLADLIPSARTVLGARKTHGEPGAGRGVAARGRLVNPQSTRSCTK